MLGEGFWPAIGLLLVLLWLGSGVAANTVHSTWAARLGSLTFAVEAIYLGWKTGPYGAEWLGIVLTAGIAAGFVYAVSRIALPVLAAAYNGTLGQMMRAWRSWRIDQRVAAQELRTRKESEARRRREQEEYERAAPERERQRQVEEQRRGVAARDAQRRKDARAACELAYSQCAIEICKRFSRQELERFMATYMGDDHPADDVERRGEELRTMMEEYRRPAAPKKARTVQQLAEWYLRERQSIESLPLDEELRLEHLAALDMRYAELSQEVLQGMQP